MRLSTKSRFAVTAMIDIALRDNTGPVSLADISVRHQISLSYLEQMFSKLRQCGLVESTRGPGGGYSLSRPSEAISLADIVGAMQTESPKPSLRGKTAAEPQDTEQWMTHELWAALNAKMAVHLQSINLRQLVSEQRAKGIKVETRPAKRGVYTAPKSNSLSASTPNSVFALGRSLAPSH